jgi:hypothetical protein
MFDKDSSEWTSASLEAAGKIMRAKAQHDAAIKEAEAAFAAALSEWNAFVAASGQAAVAPSAVVPPKATSSSPLIDGKAIPANGTCTVRIAVLRFFAAQTRAVPQEGAVGLFASAGYNDGTVRQCMYDMTSVKSKTLDRSDAGLTINANGRLALALHDGGTG